METVSLILHQNGEREREKISLSLCVERLYLQKKSPRIHPALGTESSNHIKRAVRGALLKIALRKLLNPNIPNITERGAEF